MLKEEPLIFLMFPTFPECPRRCHGRQGQQREQVGGCGIGNQKRPEKATDSRKTMDGGLQRRRCQQLSLGSPVADRQVPWSPGPLGPWPLPRVFANQHLPCSAEHGTATSGP